MSDDSPLPFDFPAVARKKVTAGFDGGHLTSDGRVMLLAAAERGLGADADQHGASQRGPMPHPPSKQGAERRSSASVSISHRLTMTTKATTKGRMGAHAGPDSSQGSDEQARGGCALAGALSPTAVGKPQHGRKRSVLGSLCDASPAQSAP